MTHRHRRLGSANDLLVGRSRMLVGFPMAALAAEHRDGRTAANETRVVCRNLQTGAVAKFSHLAGGAHDLGREQRGLQQTVAVFPKDSRLFAVSPKQDHNRALARGLVLAPVGTKRSAPERHGAKKPVFAATPAT